MHRIEIDFETKSVEWAEKVRKLFAKHVNHHVFHTGADRVDKNTGDVTSYIELVTLNDIDITLHDIDDVRFMRIKLEEGEEDIFDNFYSNSRVTVTQIEGSAIPDYVKHVHGMLQDVRETSHGNAVDVLNLKNKFDTLVDIITKQQKSINLLVSRFEELNVYAKDVLKENYEATRHVVVRLAEETNNEDLLYEVRTATVH